MPTAPQNDLRGFKTTDPWALVPQVSSDKSLGMRPQHLQLYKTPTSMHSKDETTHDSNKRMSNILCLRKVTNGGSWHSSLPGRPRTEAGGTPHDQDDHGLTLTSAQAEGGAGQLCFCMNSVQTCRSACSPLLGEGAHADPHPAAWSQCPTPHPVTRSVC